jgi:phage gp36-like protein
VPAQPYAIADDVRAAVTRDPEQTTGTAATMSDAQLELAIRAAQAEVDAALRGRYTVPFPPPIPFLVWQITVDIAAYRATLRYRQGKDLTQADPVALTHQVARQLLGSISAGKSDLDIGDGATVEESTAGGVRPARQPYGGQMFGMSDFGLGLDGGWDRGRC